MKALETDASPPTSAVVKPRKLVRAAVQDNRLRRPAVAVIILYYPSQMRMPHSRRDVRWGVCEHKNKNGSALVHQHTIILNQRTGRVYTQTKNMILPLGQTCKQNEAPLAPLKNLLQEWLQFNTRLKDVE